MEKYLYFRTEATDANDDATGDSALFPASSLMGMQPTSDTALTLYFKPMVRRDPTGSADSANSLDNHDSVVVTIPANTHIIAMRAISEIINKKESSAFVVIANDDSGGTEYLSGSGITACDTITVAAAYANS
jgi:hypothetical protein|tara:strand:- start:162 stop:557 length:396 start_codon:yes stop_codon:yes gene_type:complete